MFVLFLGGHGSTIADRYYFLPQDLDFAANQSIESDGIGQEQWQSWLAKIVAEKSVIVIDTCESASASGLVRGSDSERATAADQLQHATGRNLIAAAGQSAFEGQQLGHGLLTYAVLEALSKGSGNDEPITVSMLANYVGQAVPALSQRIFGRRQTPTRTLSGNDFPIGVRTATLAPPTAADRPPADPDYVLLRDENVRSKPATDAPVTRALKAPYKVSVREFVTGGWALIERDGVLLGYVPARSVAKPQ